MVLQISLIIAMIISIIYVIRKRKKAGIKGVKSFLTPFCFYLNAIIYLIAYWFDSIGIISWMLMILLFMMAAYFSKFTSASASDGS
ncbi:hypothetical protein MUN88_13330 [Gracilibacillus caseinilyticus]|uniref:Uncharacterized protein n=1 Tax=Gracilibacillus caseinilyticus TaxID=2932256 RepID=A0ABY4ERJ9_9BACI|nr:hypothetical protein [Gracilibacillus caseinilyticus]UOQ47062.1 hypothetical protein MUN88_13330 [Gracilibacillus caseinilyticus]